MKLEVRSRPGSMHGRPRVSLLRITLLSLLVSFVGALAVGCSVILPLTVAHSNANATASILPAEGLYELDAGVRLRITDDDGVQAEGTFLGIVQDSDSSYAFRYASMLEELGAHGLPALGEPVRMAPRSHRARVHVRSGRFAGFDYRGVRLTGDDGRTVPVAMIEVDSLWRADGRGVSGSDLSHWDADHRLPSFAMLNVRQSGHTADGRRQSTNVHVPWERAQTVESTRAGSSVIGAFVAGLAVDAIVVYALTRHHPEPAPAGCDWNPEPGFWVDLRHVRPATHDFDRFEGTYVVPEATLAAR